MHSIEARALLREAFFPYGCALCGKTLLDGQDARYGLCASCAAQFSVDTGSRCELCGKPLISEQGRCIQCKKEGAAFQFDAVTVLYPYMGKCRELLTAYKFGKQRPLGAFFADKLLEAVPLLQPAARDTVWVPVPPRPGKIKASGWDQVETLAQFLEKAAYPVRISRCIKRLESKSQKELGREERRTNLQGKIAVTSPPEKNITLFDDVFTTGATLSACASALKAAGAEKVWGICLFYD